MTDTTVTGVSGPEIIVVLLGADSDIRSTVYMREGAVPPLDCGAELAGVLALYSSVAGPFGNIVAVLIIQRAS